MSIQTAKLKWKEDDNSFLVPISEQFGDVYYSLVDGLAESRYVFLQGNRLEERLSHLQKDIFSIAELGFGTGLNFFATWQLWYDLRQKNPELKDKQLHFISFEKFPLSKADFIQSLLPWKDKDPQIANFIEQFEAVYPTLVAGCHRLKFYNDNLTLDLWLGDAADSLASLVQSSNDKKPSCIVKIDATNHIDKSTKSIVRTDNSVNIAAQQIKTTCSKENYILVDKAYIDAWFLDGFAPSCNEGLWAAQIFTQIQRLSTYGSTVATFSCAGIVKRGLKDIGFEISKIKGFGRKREMLVAQIPQCIADDFIELDSDVKTIKNHQSNNDVNDKNKQDVSIQDLPIIVIGAGISGLMAAWSLAHRGKNIIILDKNLPVSAASGNPRAVLAPKMTPIHHVEDHLHSIGYLFSARMYQQMNEVLAQAQGSELNSTSSVTNGATDLNKANLAKVIEMTTAVDFMNKANVSTEQIADYPEDFAQVLSNEQAQNLTGLTEQDLSTNQYLPQAGLINPQALAKVVLAHKNINFRQVEVKQVNENPSNGNIIVETIEEIIRAKQVVICAAYESHQLDSRIFDFRKIRGQLSWFKVTAEQLNKLPKVPLKFGGYCATFIAQEGDDKTNQLTVGSVHLLMGASFVRNVTDCNILIEEHESNKQKLLTSIPELKSVLDTDSSQWQGRAGVRSQTPDYHPVVGKLTTDVNMSSNVNLKESQCNSAVWTLSGMGAKGYAYAPICAEVLADLMTNSMPPISQELLNRLNPHRSRLQVALIP